MKTIRGKVVLLTGGSRGLGPHIANALAKKHGYSDRATFSVQSAESLDFPSDFFDIVVGVIQIDSAGAQ